MSSAIQAILLAHVVTTNTKEFSRRHAFASENLVCTVANNLADDMLSQAFAWAHSRVDLSNSTLGHLGHVNILSGVHPNFRNGYTPSGDPLAHSLTHPWRLYQNGNNVERVGGEIVSNNIPALNRVHCGRHERSCRGKMCRGGHVKASRTDWAVALTEQDEPNWTMQVRWAPRLDTNLDNAEPREGVMKMPLFPIEATYLPRSEPQLSIFEPRYRQMYNDILMSGARRFVTCNVDLTTGRFAEVGSVLYLTDLEETSEETNDMIKYIGHHEVIGRVKIVKVLNPRAAATRETYLRAEVEDLQDTDTDVDTTEAEANMDLVFQDVIDLQAKLKLTPRFRDEMKSSLAFCRQSNVTGLWDAINYWQTFLENRSEEAQGNMMDEIAQIFQESPAIEDAIEKVESGEGDVEDDGSFVVNLDDMPATVRNQFQAVIRRYDESVDSESLNSPDGLQFQAMLQSTSHAERLSIFHYLIDEERKRLAAKWQLKSIFAR